MNATHSISVTALAALVVPFAQRRLGVRLTNDDVSALIGVTLAVAHAAVYAFNRWVAPALDRWIAVRPTQAST